MNMQFERVEKLADDTPMSVLCEAWGVAPWAVESRDYSVNPISVREAGALAEIHGLKLLDVIAL